MLRSQRSEIRSVCRSQKMIRMLETQNKLHLPLQCSFKNMDMTKLSRSRALKYHSIEMKEACYVPLDGSYNQLFYIDMGNHVLFSVVLLLTLANLYLRFAIERARARNDSSRDRITHGNRISQDNREPLSMKSNLQR